MGTIANDVLIDTGLMTMRRSFPWKEEPFENDCRNSMNDSRTSLISGKKQDERSLRVVWRDLT